MMTDADMNLAREVAAGRIVAMPDTASRLVGLMLEDCRRNRWKLSAMGKELREERERREELDQKLAAQRILESLA